MMKMTRAMSLGATFGMLVGCADDDEIEGDVVPGGGTVVNVTLSEYEVTASPSSASAGEVTFSVYNGGSELHEFVVVRTDLAAADLPTNSDGSLNENGEGVEVMAEDESIAAGSTDALTVTLDAGSYVLLCNLVVQEDDEVESHFQEGMHTPFSVTAERNVRPRTATWR